MPTITNKSDAPRFIHLKKGNGLATRSIPPGESIEGELFDPKNPAYAVMQQEGVMDFGGAVQSPPPPSSEPPKPPEPPKPAPVPAPKA